MIGTQVWLTRMSRHPGCVLTTARAWHGEGVSTLDPAAGAAVGPAAETEPAGALDPRELVDQLAARAAGVGEAPGAVPLVLRLRELVDQHERREAELEALYDAAGDLSRIREVEHTLQAVTERARRLLRCDVAYLSAATNHADDFEVRAWSGQLSPKFLGTKVSTGSGLGGQVAATRRPFQVANYHSADNISHTDYLDSQVGAEKIVALLGVPLEVDGRLLGILFAGGRHAQPFDDRQVRLLSSLAAHAAVALDNAQLFASQRRALEDLEESTAALRAHTSAVETAAEVHAQLTDVLLHGHGVPDIVRIVAEALEVSVAMVDPAELLLASHGDQASTPPFSADVRRAITASRESGRSVTTTAPDGLRLYLDTAAAGGTFIGSVLLTSARPLTDVDVRTLERATQTIAVSLLADAAIAQADQRASSEVMRQLLDVRRSSPDAVDRVARRHLLTGPSVVVVVDVPADRVTTALTAASHLCSKQGGLAAPYDGHLVLVQPGVDRVVAERAWDAVRRVVAEPLTLAASRATSTLLELGRLHEETVACLRLMHRLDRVGTWATTSDFGMYSMLFTAGAEDRLEHFVRTHAGSLLDYDARHGTHLAATALAYLECNRGPAAAATTLGVHANTVAQRISRIDRLLGGNWRTAPRALEVHTALRFDRLRRELDQRRH